MTAIEKTQQSLVASGPTSVVEAWSSMFDQRPMARAQAAVVAAGIRPVVIFTEFSAQSVWAMLRRVRAFVELNSQPEPPCPEPPFHREA